MITAASAQSMALPQSPYGPMVVNGSQQMLPMMQGQQVLGMANAPGALQSAAGAEGVKPPSTIGTVAKSALTMAALGAGVGAAVTFLPFIPGGPLIGAAIGAGAGALLGIIRGVRKARNDNAQYNAMMMGSQNPGMDPNMLGPEVPVLAALAAPKSAAKKAKSKRKTVVVRRGDTLGRIAKAHGITVQQLHDANRKAIGTNPNMIHVGTKLVLPAKRKKH